MPKIMADAAMAVRRATRLIPCEPWPVPTPPDMVELDAGAEDVVEDMVRMRRRR